MKTKNGSVICLNQSYLLCMSSTCAFIVNPLWPRPRSRPRPCGLGFGLVHFWPH